ncbi:subtilisin-like protease Glyma18g48580 [Cajanus cajan]|uniref:subtilisin-like protease Glyma18g48580 n=1 Tax=Cajanus cajan TaxID=3821 RepID=UPI0010FB6658|nr:subtilisin-like protease Glyma18g48580 [Cajanus cajan]
MQIPQTVKEVQRLAGRLVSLSWFIPRNILLVASAGNDGPTPGSVVNVAPWVFTIAASTIDRDFTSTLTIANGNNNQQITGASLFVNLPPNQAFSLILATDAKLSNATFRDAQLCRRGTLDPRKVHGKIVSCVREGKIKSVGEGQEALSAGAKGMILDNQQQSGNTLLAEPHQEHCLEAAIDQAIDDGVDIINLSAGGSYVVTPEGIFTDEVSIGAFHAIARNILLVASAGNDGPTPGSVVNVAPWVFTIAASTIDRDFSSTLTIVNGNNNQQITGASLFVNLPPNQAFSLILSIDAKLANATFKDAQLCRPGTLDPTKVNGKIVSCTREGKIKSVAEGQEALSAGARGMVLGNQNQNGRTLLAEPHVLSTVTRLAIYANTTPSAFHRTATDDPISSGATIKISGARTLLGRRPAPVMASFSSRGPNLIQPSILKVLHIIITINIGFVIYRPYICILRLAAITTSHQENTRKRKRGASKDETCARS